MLSINSVRNIPEPLSFEQFPKDILLDIFSRISWRDLGAVRRVCRRWRVLGSDARLIPLWPKAFGARAWREYFGEVGAEPLLPVEIYTILQAPCPFWPGKKVFETHMLVLIPEKVSGKPFCLNFLRELIQRPKQGPATNYKYYVGIKLENKTRVPDKAYWVLLTRDVLPDTRNKTFQEQKQKVDSIGSGYELPGLLEAATSILIEHLRSGKRLYSDAPYTYTRCQEVGNYGCHCVVGGFAASGVQGHNHRDDFRYEHIGVGVRRKFW